MNPFSLSDTENGLARLSALSKMFALMILSMASMYAQAFELSLLLLTGLLAHCIFRISLKDSSKMLLFILYISIFISFVGILDPNDDRLFSFELLPHFLLYALRLYSVFFFSHLFYTSTKVSDLGNYMTKLVQKERISRINSNLAIDKYADSLDPGMALTMTLLFLPRSFSIYATVHEAAEIRGYGLKKQKIADFLKILETFMLFSIRNALRTANAMRIRGYSPWRTVRVQRFQRGDYILLFCSIVLVFPILC